MFYSRYIKRAADISSSVLLIILLSWIFLVIILLYLSSFQLPVFFRQVRVGKHERLFTLVKFRTLKTSEGTLQSRRFWLGDFLRFTSLDELPQLWNVISGDMSLIGPRPLPVHYLHLFSQQQKVRHDVRPGITGLAQVRGRHNIRWEDKFAFDVYYVKHVSLMLDVKIILRTLWLLISLKKDTSLDEKPFTGPSA